MQQQGTEGGIVVCTDCKSNDDNDDGVYHSVAKLHESDGSGRDSRNGSARFLIDLNKCLVLLANHDDEGASRNVKQQREEQEPCQKVELVHVLWQETVMKPVLAGVREVMKVLSEDESATTGEQQQEATKNPTTSSPPPSNVDARCRWPHYCSN